MGASERPDADATKVRAEAQRLLVDILSFLRQHVPTLVIYLALLLAIIVIGLLLSIRYATGVHLAISAGIGILGGGGLGWRLLRRQVHDEQGPELPAGDPESASTADPRRRAPGHALHLGGGGGERGDEEGGGAVRDRSGGW